MTDATALVAERVDKLLADVDPASADPVEFRGRQYDLGLAWVHFPEGLGGLGAPPALQRQVDERIYPAGATPPGSREFFGWTLAGPTVVTYAEEPTRSRLLRRMWTGEDAWCQLFSEPGAGSDLAGLGTRAVRDGDEWIVNGQKVWTSGGQIADMGMLVARTNPDAPKHQGITWFAFDMHQDGAVDVRPLREMTGRALFNEVFLSDARVPDSWVVGGTNNGWAVANATLTFERQGLSAGGQGHAALALPGTVAGDLPKRAGDFIRPRNPGSGGAGAMVAGSQKVFVDLARANGRITDPTVRQGLVKLHTLTEIARFTNLRAKAERERGRELPGVGNLGKLTMSDVVRTSRDLGLAILGPLGTLHAYTTEDRRALDAATGEPATAYVTEMALFAQAPPIYGGTDQVQRNIVGERVLGLPKEPSDERTKPWSELPRNG
jgi:alkylation response protein AidB-like acyl-CoA dehydrogenase